MATSLYPFLEPAARTIMRLQAALADARSITYFLGQLGWQAQISEPEVATVQQAFGMLDLAEQAQDLLTQLRYQQGDSLTVSGQLLTLLRTSYQTISALQTTATTGLPAPLGEPGFWATIVRDVPAYLLAKELQAHSPALYSVLYLSGTLTETTERPTGPSRRSYARYSLSWESLSTFLTRPSQAFATRYGWGTASFQHQELLADLNRLANLFSLNARRANLTLGAAQRYYTQAQVRQLGSAALVVPLLSGIAPGDAGLVELGLAATPIPAQPLNGLAPTGLLIAPVLRGTSANRVTLNDHLQVVFGAAFASDTAIGVELYPDLVRFIASPTTTTVGASVALVSAPQTPHLLLGTARGTRLELTGYRVGIAVTGPVAAPELSGQLGTGAGAKLRVIIDPTETDSFLGQLFGGQPLNWEVSGEVTWSSQRGLGFNGGTSLAFKNAQTRTLGPLTLLSYALSLASTDDAVLAATATIDAALSLGPVRCTISELGISLRLTQVAATSTTKGILNNLDVEAGIAFPKGVGLTIQSDLITGGGYLLRNPAVHQYAGVANLQLNKKINLTALGLLQTELPGNPDAYSLLLLITATFNPIQLGLGFTLNGVGGLLGVNRAIDTDYLRGLVRGGHLDQLLFPANVLANPAAALALVDAAFPATEGRYVIGLLARLGWGTPTSLITLDVALLVELPSPVRLAILGVLEATLPSQDKDLLKLRADFLGTVDFGSKRAAFDATLSDSHLLAFALTGDLAFRFYQGNNPLFVISAGGFHPAFQPPAGAGLAGLRRLTLSLARGDLRVTLASYFAVTSNTVQFGSRLELYYLLARGLHVEGYFGFDVLFQFSPFHVQAHVAAGVAVKYGSRELLSLYLALDVTGPGPWHLWGSASFRVWGVGLNVAVDTSIGSGTAEPALPATDVETLLVTALSAAASWEVEAPATALPGGVVLRPMGPTAAPFFLDPRGALLLRQRVVPLGVQLGRYGRGPIAPATGQRFDLTELVVAGVHHPVATDGAVDVVRDFFAPDQFQQLTDAQKLSLPSFQLLPCGLRLTRTGGLVADDKATLRVVEYEHKLISGASGGATTSRPPKMSANGYQQLVRGGALGQEVEAARPSVRAPQPVNWAEDGYVVVHAATLEVYDPLQHARFATQVEAEQFRQGLVATTPALAAEVLVVPEYQLELA